MVMYVLNLVISGIPSILEEIQAELTAGMGFKPCYKWNTLNTLDLNKDIEFMLN